MLRNLITKTGWLGSKLDRKCGALSTNQAHQIPMLLHKKQEAGNELLENSRQLSEVEANKAFRLLLNTRSC